MANLWRLLAPRTAIKSAPQNKQMVPLKSSSSSATDAARLSCSPTRRPSTADQSRLVSILLPLILVFLLPRPDLETTTTYNQPASVSSEHQTLATTFLIDALFKFPFDRVRLVFGLIPFVSADKVSSDLQEEETHMVLLAPGDHQAPGKLSHHQAPIRNSAGYQSGPPPNAAHADLQAGPQEYGEPQDGTVEPASGPAESNAIDTSASSSAPARNDNPTISALNVKCEKNHMTVNIVFDRPFYGTVFSKGHYNDPKCVHLPPNTGQTSVNFDIHLGKCGMSSSDASPNALQVPGQQQPNGLYIENTIIVQYDPQVQEIVDQARKLRCTWYDYYEKSVSFRPYNVDMLDAITANFLGDNIQCWMQIQVGKGPWSSEVAGIVKIGQTMTMVLAIKDDENRFDMLVRNCIAHDNKHPAIQLVDEYGCVVRPKIMGKFQKVQNFGPAATVVSYAHFKAFKFPDSMSVHFQCVIQVCRVECPQPVCNGSPGEQPALGGPSQPSQGDYATSGTEMVASKETAAFVPHTFASNHTHPASSVNLKLDENQGRVQVKLDTSMLSPGQRSQHINGPLPPHLLHAQSQPAEPVRASFHRPTPSRFVQQATGGSSGGQPTILGSRVAPPSHPQVYYSSPYSHKSYQSRMGQLAEGAVGTEDPLSLIALPRGLRTATLSSSSTSPPGPLNHKLTRRNVDEEAGNTNGSQAKVRRDRRSTPADSAESTSIKTEKTIQVVSSDDVAFSLLEDTDFATGAKVQTGKRQPSSASIVASGIDDKTVCFSANKMIFAILVTLASLATSIGTVVFFIFKKRCILSDGEGQDDEKATGGKDISYLYSVDEPGRANGQHLAPYTSTHQACRIAQDDKQQVQQVHEAILQRQRREMQQRTNYLSRLYSQFAPTTHWR